MHAAAAPSLPPHAAALTRPPPLSPRPPFVSFYAAADPSRGPDLRDPSRGPGLSCAECGIAVRRGGPGRAGPGRGPLERFIAQPGQGEAVTQETPKPSPDAGASTLKPVTQTHRPAPAAEAVFFCRRRRLKPSEGKDTHIWRAPLPPALAAQQGEGKGTPYVGG